MRSRMSFAAEFSQDFDVVVPEPCVDPLQSANRVDLGLRKWRSVRSAAASVGNSAKSGSAALIEQVSVQFARVIFGLADFAAMVEQGEWVFADIAQTGGIRCGFLGECLGLKDLAGSDACGCFDIGGNGYSFRVVLLFDPIAPTLTQRKTPKRTPGLF